MPRYTARKHDDHWHVVDETDDNIVFDDRPYAPWWYGKRKEATAVAVLLNRGVPVFELRLMTMDEIYAELSNR